MPTTDAHRWSELDTDDTQYFSSTEVCKQVGMSYRQLDYWRRTGKIPGRDLNAGSGVPIWWTAEEIEQIKALWEKVQFHVEALRELGFEPTKQGTRPRVTIGG